MSFHPRSPLRIGTRGSPLALAQAHETRDRLMARHNLPQTCFEIVVIKTTGDRVQDRPLSEIGGKGLFTKEIEEALLAGDIHIAVHSMKDMPTEQPEGLIIDCFLPRGDVRDAFISRKFPCMSDLPTAAVVGTSSLRRTAQLRHRRPDLRIVEFRGNVQTRLRKLSDGVADATLLAMAGLERLGLADLAGARIDTADILPAIGQGAIGIERRQDDLVISKFLHGINHPETAVRLASERALLKGLDGSCQTPMAGLAELNDGQLHLRGQILRPDGSEELTHQITGPKEAAVAIGQEMAAILKERSGGGFF